MLTLQFVISSLVTRIFSGIVGVGFFSIQAHTVSSEILLYRNFILKITRSVFFIGEEVEEVFAEDYDDPIKENTTPVSTEQGMETGDSQVKPLVHEVSACPNRCFILFL